jgi:hypothetical protein
MEAIFTIRSLYSRPRCVGNRVVTIATGYSSKQKNSCSCQESNPCRPARSKSLSLYHIIWGSTLCKWMKYNKIFAPIFRKKIEFLSSMPCDSYSQSIPVGCNTFKCQIWRKFAEPFKCLWMAPRDGSPKSFSSSGALLRTYSLRSPDIYCIPSQCYLYSLFMRA